MTIAVDEEHESRQHMAVLTEASAALGGAGLDPPLVLDTITDLLVEHMGDSAIVYLLGEDGVDFELGSVTSRNPVVMPVANRIETAARYRIDDDSLVARCARHRVPFMFPRVDLRDLDPPLPTGYRSLFDETPLRSLAYVPLASQAETLGVLAVTRILANREPMDDADFELLCDLGELATRSLTNMRLHRELADSTALFETAFRSAPIGMALISTTDDPGRLVRVNASMSAVTGYDEDELLSMRVPDLFARDVRERVEDDLRAATEGALATTVALGNLVRRDGTEVAARVDARAVQVPGRPSRIGLMQVQSTRRPLGPADRSRRADGTMVPSSRRDPLGRPSPRQEPGQPGRMSPGGGGSGAA